MTRLGEVSEGRDNNFNLLRMAAAFAVLVSHAYPIAGGFGATQPLENSLGEPLGAVAVYVFFGISGFLIAASYTHSSSVTSWGAARFLRLAPGLIVVLLLTVLVLGPFVTTLRLQDYFSQPRTLSYIPRNMALFPIQYDLPGVFENNPYPVAVNGPLWTLLHEVICYLGVLALGLAGALRRPGLMLAALVLYAAFWLSVTFAPMDLPERLTDLARLSLPFVVGTAFFVWRDRILLHPGIAAILVFFAWLLHGTAVFHPAFDLALVYCIFLIAHMPGQMLRRYNRLGDYSYGFYIYAFPMQQLAVHLTGRHSPVANMALAAPVTLLLAALSWHLVERRALASRKDAVIWLNRRLNRT